MKFIISLTLFYITFVFSSLHEMHILQEHGYNENNSFLKYALNDIKNNYLMYILKILFALVLLLAKNYNMLLFLLYLFVISILLISSYTEYDNHNIKKPLKFTKRLIRVLFINYIVLLIFNIYSSRMETNIFLGLNLLYLTINSFILILNIYILYPVERLIFNHYKTEAINKLNKMNDIKVIGITGSFGKTSTKMILDSILKTTYKGFATPASFNTPNGLTITINNQESIFNDYFIAEMGAKVPGEIKELCSIVHPQYAILTSIGPAHLESFKTIENIAKTKFELIESLDEAGIAILNKDDENISKYNYKSKCKVIWIGIENDADVMAKDIKVTKDGTSFTVIFNGQRKQLKVNTILLGKKNVYNILSSIALSKELGVDDKNIQRGVKNIEAINHRLELKNNGNITIIDDSFNSNPEGAKNALEVLSLVNTKKIIITPGMVEMGTKQNELNKAFGTQISDVCDKVYLIGKNQTRPIYEGLIEKGYNKENIIIKSSFNDAFNEVKNMKNTTVLIENDLPDSYREEE